MGWVLVVLGVAAMIAFGALTAAQLRRGGPSPGSLGEPFVTGHDEPQEDTAAAIHREHDANSPTDEARDTVRLEGR